MSSTSSYQRETLVGAVHLSGTHLQADVLLGRDGFTHRGAANRSTLRHYSRVIVMEAFSNAHLRIRVKPVDEADFPQRSNSAIVCRHSGGRMLKRAVVLLVVGAVSVLGQRSN